jgi:hypothetical protein
MLLLELITFSLHHNYIQKNKRAEEIYIIKTDSDRFAIQNLTLSGHYFFRFRSYLIIPIKWLSTLFFGRILFKEKVKAAENISNNSVFISLTVKNYHDNNRRFN